MYVMMDEGAYGSSGVATTVIAHLLKVFAVWLVDLLLMV